MIAEMAAVDPRDGVALRSYYETLRSQLEDTWSSWKTQAAEKARYFTPRNQQFNYLNVNNGTRKDQYIVDNTGLTAVRVLVAGIFSSKSSPVDRWTHMQTERAEDMEAGDVKEWIDDSEDRLADALLQSNYYSALLTQYRDMVVFGTGAKAIMEDAETTFRCYNYPIGSFYISGDSTLRTDLSMRIFNMSVRQMVGKFGYDHVSSAMQTQYNSPAGGNKETMYPVVHVVHKNTYYDSKTADLDEKPWVSVYYEMSNFDTSTKPTGLLRQGGFDENPVSTGRWDVVGENFYGEAPCDDCLGDVKGLQLLQKRKAQAIDKQVNPPMVADPALANQSLTVLPGQVTFANMKEGSPGFKAAYQVQFELQYLLQDIKDHQTRINDTLFKSLFLMNSDSDRKDITATEIEAKKQERMLVLGPVATRMDSEVLSADMERVFNIMWRAGKFKKPPASLKGKKIKFTFESILGRAQKIQRTANIDRLMALLGSQVAVNQGVLDNFDLDALSVDYAKDLGVPANGFRDEDAIAKIRSDRQAQQQQAAQADNAQKMAIAGQTLSKTDTSSDNALTRLMPQGAAPTAAQ